MNSKHLVIKRIKSANQAFLKNLDLLLKKNKRWDNKQGKKFFKNENSALFVAFSNNKLVGFAIAYKLQRFDQKGAEILLDEIEVVKEYRKEGIGKKIIESVKNWGKKTGAKEIWIPTNKSNQAAVALYKSAGGKAENKDDIIFVIKI